MLLLFKVRNTSELIIKEIIKLYRQLSSSSSNSSFNENVRNVQKKLINRQVDRLRNYENEENEEDEVNNRFDMNIPVHKKMMQLYFKADEYIEEASCEQSLMSTARRDPEGTPIKNFEEFLEQEIPLDLSQISIVSYYKFIYKFRYYLISHILLGA